MRGSGPIPVRQSSSQGEAPTDGRPGVGHRHMTGSCMALVFLLSSAPLYGDGLPDPIQAPDLDTANLSSYVRSFVGPRRLPGVAVSIVGKDGPLYQAGFGKMGESGESVTEAVRFQAGPFVEAITGFAILQLADSGRIDLDEPVHHYLPGLAFRNRERTRRLTLRHLITHTSGLTAMSAFNRRVRLEKRLDHIDFSHEPGTYHQESPINYMILETVLESVTGRTYEDWVSEHVFRPLGMRSSTAHPEEALEDHVPRGNRYFFGWAVPIHNPISRLGTASTTRVMSSAEDIGLFLSLFLNGELLGNLELLSPDRIAVMMEPLEVESQTVKDNRFAKSALVPLLKRSEGRSGFHVVLTVLPEEGYGVVVLANRSGGPFLGTPDALMKGILAKLSGTEPHRYRPWERFLHAGLLVFLSAQWLIALHWRRRWMKLGRPRATAHTAPIISRLVLDLTLAAALPLIFLLHVIEMPIQAVLFYQPDWGLATILLPVFLVPTSVWRTLVHSEEWRAHDYAH